MIRFEFETEEFEAVRIDLPPNAMVRDAKRRFSDLWKCSIDNLVIFSGGRPLSDNETMETISSHTWGQTRPAIFRQTKGQALRAEPPAPHPAPVPVQPDNLDFSDQVQIILGLGITTDTALIESALRNNRKDINAAVGSLLGSSRNVSSQSRPPARPRPQSPPPERSQMTDADYQRLMRMKPPQMPEDQAITLFVDACHCDFNNLRRILAGL
jgi:hypothetical protein